MGVAAGVLVFSASAFTTEDPLSSGFLCVFMSSVTFFRPCGEEGRRRGEGEEVEEEVEEEVKDEVEEEVKIRVPWLK